MLIYIYLLVYILIVAVVSKVLFKKPEKQKVFCIIISMLAIYLVLALKAPSVGRDIEGYKRMYESFKYASWNNYDLYWTETGYEFLQMFFTHILKFDFQGFAACIYAFSIISYAIFFYKYSVDVTISIFVYICFGFFTFDISGIRNMLAIAIVLFAVRFAEKKSFWWNLVYFALVFLGAQIHRGVYFSFLMFFFIRFSFEKAKKLLLPLFAIIALAFRPFANNILASLNTENKVEEISIGGNIIVYIFALLFPFIIWSVAKYENGATHKYEVQNTKALNSEAFFANMRMPLRVFYFGIIATVLAGTGTLVRISQAPLFFMTLVLPAPIEKLEPKSRLVIKTIVYGLLGIYFYIFKLRANDLDIRPYIFYWNY